MDSGDEAFNEFIEVDYSETVSDCDPDEEKENSAQSVSTKSKPTKKAQINKIIAFVKDNNEQLIEKSLYDLLWHALTEDLNRLGPPEYTSDKWKRVWSQYKYRNKTRLTELLSTARQNEPLSDTGAVPKRPKMLTDEETIQTENRLSAQITKILEQQDIMTNVIVEQGVTIKRNNELLERLSKNMK